MIVDSTVAQQIGIIVGFFLILCGAFWWLYYREAKRLDERHEAERRAQRLIHNMLTREQRDQLSSIGFLELRSRLIPGRCYRVPRRRGQVQVYEDGRHAGSLCLVTTRWVPDSDWILIHKWMIEGDEADYLRTANFFKPYRVA